MIEASSTHTGSGTPKDSTSATNKISHTEKEMREKVLAHAGKISASSVMSMSRAERRRIGKLNGGVKIPGSRRPFVTAEHKNKKGVLNVE